MRRHRALFCYQRMKVAGLSGVDMLKYKYDGKCNRFCVALLDHNGRQQGTSFLGRGTEHACCPFSRRKEGAYDYDDA